MPMDPENLPTMLENSQQKKGIYLGYWLFVIVKVQRILFYCIT